MRKLRRNLKKRKKKAENKFKLKKEVITIWKQ